MPHASYLYPLLIQANDYCLKYIINNRDTNSNDK